MKDTFWPKLPGMYPERKALDQAYRRTRYRVFDWALDIRIGTRHPELDRLLEEFGIRQWAFLSACNPGSTPLDQQENSRRTKLLGQALMPWPHWSGLGIPVDPGWEPEASYLIGGIPLEEALVIARAFGQLALVAGTRGRKAALVWC